MRELVERELPDTARTGGPRRGARRSVTVNVAESPLAWLQARGMIDRRKLEAGERLRHDYETAQLGPRVTMNWSGAPRGPRSGAGTSALDPALAQVAAKRRFDAALAALGNGLQDVAWRVICAGEGLPAAEKGLGWPARSGKVVLVLALDRLADHYRLP